MSYENNNRFHRNSSHTFNEIGQSIYSGIVCDFTTFSTGNLNTYCPYPNVTKRTILKQNLSKIDNELNEIKKKIYFTDNRSQSKISINSNSGSNINVNNNNRNQNCIQISQLGNDYTSLSHKDIQNNTFYGKYIKDKNDNYYSKDNNLSITQFNFYLLSNYTNNHDDLIETIQNQEKTIKNLLQNIMELEDKVKLLEEEKQKYVSQNLQYTSNKKTTESPTHFNQYPIQQELTNKTSTILKKNSKYKHTINTHNNIGFYYSSQNSDTFIDKVTKSNEYSNTEQRNSYTNIHSNNEITHLPNKTEPINKSNHNDGINLKLNFQYGKTVSKKQFTPLNQLNNNNSNIKEEIEYIPSKSEFLSRNNYEEYNIDTYSFKYPTSKRTNNTILEQDSQDLFIDSNNNIINNNNGEIDNSNNICFQTGRTNEKIQYDIETIDSGLDKNKKVHKESWLSKLEYITPKSIEFENEKDLYTTGENLLFTIYDKKRILCFNILTKKFNLYEFADFSNFDENLILEGTIQLNLPNMLYIITGKNYDHLYKFSFDKKTISFLAKTKTNHKYGTLIYCEKSHELICLSGANNRSIEKYSINKNNWTLLLNEMTTERSHQGINIVNGSKIFSFFGYNYKSNVYLNSIEYCDIDNNYQSNKVSVTYDNNFVSCLKLKHLAIISSFSEVILLGGYCGNSNEYNTNVYDIKININDNSCVIKVNNLLLNQNDENNPKMIFTKGNKFFDINASKERDVYLFDNDYNMHCITSNLINHFIYNFQ